MLKVHPTFWPISLCLLSLAEAYNSPLLTIDDALLSEYMGYGEKIVYPLDELRLDEGFRAIIEYDSDTSSYNVSALIRAADSIAGTDSLSEGPDTKKVLN